MSHAKYHDLLRAGAPELPAEHFYAVRYRRVLGFDLVRVRICERIWWRAFSAYRPWSRICGEAEIKVNPDSGLTAVEVVVRACKAAMRAAELDTEAASRQRALDKLAGRHGHRY